MRGEVSKMYTPEIKKPVVLSVTGLTMYIKSLIEGDRRLNTVFLSGEISNLRSFTKGKHAYFTLKDDGAVISAAMFAGNTLSLRFLPTEGMSVICRGRVELYPPHGKYQLIVEDMQPDGVGALSLAYEQLKKKLDAEGLFSPEHKKPIPPFPKTVGVITSPTGAAVEDIKNILYRRFPCVDMLLYPVQVQGDKAAPQLAEAVKQLDSMNVCDVIIIGRGGGSMEDLWAFNDEELARTIYNCSAPVISAVGHETDFTICDFVSDLRAPTPSAAAELAVPDKAELMQGYNEKLRLINRTVKTRSEHFEKLNQSIFRQLEALSPMSAVELESRKLELLTSKLENSMDSIMKKAESNMKAEASRLEALNPVAVLARGYSIAEKDGRTIASKSMLSTGDKIKLTFSDGSVGATVDSL